MKFITLLPIAASALLTRVSKSEDNLQNLVNLLIQDSSDVSQLYKDYSTAVLEAVEDLAEKSSSELTKQISALQLDVRKQEVIKNNANVAKQTHQTKLDLEMKNLEKAKSEFMDFLSGIQQGTLDDTDAVAEQNEQQKVLTEVLEAIKSQAGSAASELEGVFQQMIMDAGNDAEEQAAKKAQTVKLLNEALEKRQNMIGQVNDEINLAMEEKFDQTLLVNKAKYEHQISEAVVETSQEDLSLFVGMQKDKAAMAEANVARSEALSAVVSKTFKIVQDIKAFTKSVKVQGLSTNDALAKIGRSALLFLQKRIDSAPKSKLKSAGDKLASVLAKFAKKPAPVVEVKVDAESVTLPDLRFKKPTVVTKKSGAPPDKAAAATKEVPDEAKVVMSITEDVEKAVEVDNHDADKIKLASDVIQSAADALRKPLLAEFAKKMLNQDIGTNVNALNMIESDLKMGKGQAAIGFEAKSTQAPCSVESLNAAKDAVEKALDEKIAAKKTVLEAQSYDGILDNVIKASNDAATLEGSLKDNAMQLKDTVLSGCDTLETSLMSKRQSTANAAGEELNQFYSTLSDANAHIPSSLAHELDPMMQEHTAAMDKCIDEVQKECQALKDQLDTIGDTLSANMENRKQVVSEWEKGVPKSSLEAAQKTLSDAETNLEAARQEFKDKVASCPTNTSLLQLDSKITIKAIDMAKSIMNEV